MTIFTNAYLVLEGAILHGTLTVHQGQILEIESGRSSHPSAIDMEGDTLIPGVVDVHTDNLERQVQPRANARWPSRSALLIHDAQCAAAGVTTVLDALCLGDLGFDQSRDQTFIDGVKDLTALAPSGLLKADHLLHLRCELPAGDMPLLLEGVAAHPLLAMVSLMDHSPGYGQYRDLERYRAMRIRQTQMTEDEVERRIEELRAQRVRFREPHRRLVLQRFNDTGILLASHDDEDGSEVERNAADGIRASEFPVTMEAAETALRLGVEVIAGAPNIVRGGSHSGNVAAMDLLKAGTVSAMASDYVPQAMVEAAFLAAAECGLPRAISMITAAPARMCGLHDRGRLAPGLRADIVRLREHEGMQVIREVWRQGTRVA